MPEPKRVDPMQANSGIKHLPVPVLRLDVVGEGLGLDVRGVVTMVVVV
jgi:hypothetical protein